MGGITRRRKLNMEYPDGGVHACSCRVPYVVFTRVSVLLVSIFGRPETELLGFRLPTHIITRRMNYFFCKCRRMFMTLGYL